MEHLACLVLKWEPKVRLIPVEGELSESWGPTLHELAQIQYYEFHDSTGSDGDGSDEEWKDDEESDDDDAEFAEAVEVSAWTDEYRDNQGWYKD